jgi:glycosyltransferase involved in cell wall biosynthesis
MKIGVISNLFPPKVCGGYEIVCGQVVEGLREREENLQVLTSTACPKEGRDYVWNTLSCSMGVGFSKMSRLAKLRYLFRHERTNLRAFQSFLQAVQPDVLYFWNLSQTSRSMLSLARQSGIPYGTFVFDHGLCEVSTDPWLSQFAKVPGNQARTVQRFLMAVAAMFIRRPGDLPLDFDFIHYPTQYLKSLLEKFGIRARKWNHVPWGVDTEMFHSAEVLPQGKLLYVGQVSPHKGVHLAIEAVGLLKKRNPELPVSLSIAGRCATGIYEQELLDLVAKYQLEDSVNFMGFMDRKDLPELYRQHSILLFPSVWDEPMGISILEAMACGLVVISSGTGGSAELFVDGESGLRFKSEDSQDFSGKLEMILGNPERMRKMGMCAVQKCIQKYKIFNTIDLIKNYKL